jgi:hypothetical protein
MKRGGSSGVEVYVEVIASPSRCRDRKCGMVKAANKNVAGT